MIVNNASLESSTVEITLKLRGQRRLAKSGVKYFDYANVLDIHIKTMQ
jgi:hypothetical protein